ncbi:MAG TPA: isoprenylcysteine carboxylmethyltransferase family protein [Acidobacteriota bacterium]|nr:isoprenylcysteine carboxylmethyltransferase family protein [Acidobacteriota bacterium]
MVSARASQTADFIGRVIMVIYFAFLATIQTMGIIHLFRDDTAAVRFFDLAPRLANLSFVLLVIAMTVARIKPVRSAEGLEPRFSALIGTCLAGVLTALPLTDVGPAMEITALSMVIVGWMLSAYVLIWLGRAFSIMAQARRLVTTGPYAIVRHPLYLCEEIAMIGIALTHWSPEAALIVCVQWLFQLRRMTNEETVLRATFPEYAAYAARTPKVIPRLFPRFSLGHA